jgi:hypothetical protein
MRKYELEQQLMDPDGVKRLVERATGIKERYGGSGEAQGDEAERVKRMAPTLTSARPPDTEDVQNGDFDFITMSDLTISLTRFVAEAQDVDDPRRVLKAVTDRCKGNPSESNQVFLQDAINELITTCELDSESAEILNDALEVLESAGRPQGERQRTQ